jgi:hypothetical protein
MAGFPSMNPWESELMTTLWWIALVLAMIGFLFGLASAWFWLRSSRVSFEVVHPLNFIGGSPAVTERHLEHYVARVGRLNARAAICGAIAVACSSSGGLIGLWLSIPSVAS